MKVLPLIIFAVFISGCSIFCPKPDYSNEPVTETTEVLIPVSDLPKAPETMTESNLDNLPYKSLSNQDRKNYPKIVKALYSTIKILESEVNIKTDFIKAYNDTITKIENKKKEESNKSEE